MDAVLELYVPPYDMSVSFEIECSVGVVNKLVSLEVHDEVYVGGF
jgi:hypothetical protein